MKPIIITTNHLAKDVIAMTLCPFILVKKGYKEEVSAEEYAVTLNHESIHVRQQLEMLILPFYIAYGLNWLINVIQRKSDPYWEIIFEQEAYNHQDDMNYLKTRKLFACFRKKK